MSNRRSNRRPRQVRRYEKSRKPVVITKAMDALIAAQPAERERKARVARAKATRGDREKLWRRLTVLGKPRRVRKPRTNYGATFWRHSLDN